MTLLSWKSEYSIGIESVDFEHQEMIRLINALYDEMKERKDAESIEQFLGDVHMMISAHFALEEHVMRLAEYDEYEAHKEDHEELLDQIRNLMDEFAKDPDTGIALLQGGLSNWFEEHFSMFDARLHGKLQMPNH